jgi:hypothetical protein
MAGYQGRIVARFNPVELRPDLELEPQKVMKSARLKQDLSAGLITDLEYHMEMYGRPPDRPASPARRKLSMPRHELPWPVARSRRPAKSKGASAGNGAPPV